MKNNPEIGYRDPEFDGIESTEEWAVLLAQKEAGDGLYSLFAKANITKAALAKSIQTSPAYVSKLFRGDVNFTIASLVKLARSLAGEVKIQIEPTLVNTQHYITRKSSVRIGFGLISVSPIPLERRSKQNVGITFDSLKVYTRYFDAPQTIPECSNEQFADAA